MSPEWSDHTLSEDDARLNESVEAPEEEDLAEVEHDVAVTLAVGRRAEGLNAQATDKLAPVPSDEARGDDTAHELAGFAVEEVEGHDVALRDDVLHLRAPRGAELMREKPLMELTELTWTVNDLNHLAGLGLEGGRGRRWQALEDEGVVELAQFEPLGALVDPGVHRGLNHDLLSNFVQVLIAEVEMPICGCRRARITGDEAGDDPDLHAPDHTFLASEVFSALANDFHCSEALAVRIPAECTRNDAGRLVSSQQLLCRQPCVVWNAAIG